MVIRKHGLEVENWRNCWVTSLSASSALSQYNYFCELDVPQSYAISTHRPVFYLTLGRTMFANAPPQTPGCGRVSSPRPPWGTGPSRSPSSGLRSSPKFCWIRATWIWFPGSGQILLVRWILRWGKWNLYLDWIAGPTKEGKGWSRKSFLFTFSEKTNLKPHWRGWKQSV